MIYLIKYGVLFAYGGSGREAGGGLLYEMGGLFVGNFE